MSADLVTHHCCRFSMAPLYETPVTNSVLEPRSVVLKPRSVVLTPLSTSLSLFSSLQVRIFVDLMLRLCQLLGNFGRFDSVVVLTGCWVSILLPGFDIHVLWFSGGDLGVFVCFSCGFFCVCLPRKFMSLKAKVCFAGDMGLAFG